MLISIFVKKTKDSRLASKDIISVQFSTSDEGDFLQPQTLTWLNSHLFEKIYKHAVYKDFFAPFVSARRYKSKYTLSTKGIVAKTSLHEKKNSVAKIIEHSWWRTYFI